MQKYFIKLGVQFKMNVESVEEYLLFYMKIEEHSDDLKT